MTDWISVDMMPVQGEIVDIYSTKFGRVPNCYWDKESYRSKKWYWARQGGDDPYFTGGLVGGVQELDKNSVTHWMEIPEPPK